MKGKLVLLLVLIISSTYMMRMGFDIPAAKASNVYPVHNLNTGLNYTTIQEAINANETQNGHKISVELGVYYEHVVVNKSLSIFGEDKERTIIDGSGTGTAIRIERSHANLSGFTIRHAYSGIAISSTSYTLSKVTVNGNIISDNSCFGIIAIGSLLSWPEGEYHMLKGNSIKNNQIGIELDGCINVTICQNEIENNTEYGIGLGRTPKQPPEFSGSHKNLLFCNTVADNSIGIYILGMDNKIYHNNFLHNLNQANINIQSHDNNWSMSYPECGNYWSNYVGSDLNNDGIGDIPHIIDIDNTDAYPLMGMFSDFKATSEHYVQTICNSTISHFQFNGTAISFNVSGENDTTGFCRICIPTALMNATYKVYVNGTEVSSSLLSCSNSTHSYLYFNYTHSTQEVIIVPEFPSSLILSLFMIATMLAIIIHRRKRISISWKSSILT
jgi:parallel beta-helix repeat protein